MLKLKFLIMKRTDVLWGGKTTFIALNTLVTVLNEDLWP